MVEEGFRENDILTEVLERCKNWKTIRMIRGVY